MGSRGRPKQYPEHRPVMAVRLPKSLYKQVHHVAIDRETTVTKIVESALQQYLKHPQRATAESLR